MDAVRIRRTRDAVVPHLEDMFDALRIVDIDVHRVVGARVPLALQCELQVSVMVEGLVARDDRVSGYGFVQRSGDRMEGIRVRSFFHQSRRDLEEKAVLFQPHQAQKMIEHALVIGQPGGCGFCGDIQEARFQ